jgi:hypothetical protein
MSHLISAISVVNASQAAECWECRPRLISIYCRRLYHPRHCYVHENDETAAARVVQSCGHGWKCVTYVWPPTLAGSRKSCGQGGNNFSYLVSRRAHAAVGSINPPLAGASISVCAAVSGAEAATATLTITMRECGGQVWCGKLCTKPACAWNYYFIFAILSD